MSQFTGGVENFTPAFTGQQIANQTGAGAAQAFTSGMNAGTNKDRQGKGKMMQPEADTTEINTMMQEWNSMVFGP